MIIFNYSKVRQGGPPCLKYAAGITESVSSELYMHVQGDLYLPHVHAQGVKQLVLSIVIGMKIATSQDLGV